MSVYTILHVEDDPNDAFLVQHALEKSGTTVQVRVVGDGQQALDYLAGTGEFADRGKFPVPQLVLLDLKMPKLSGFDVLVWLRGQERFSNLPVVVLSSSDHLDDKCHARKLGASDYEVKSPGFEGVVRIIKQYTDLRRIPVWAAGNQQSPALTRHRVP